MKLFEFNGEKVVTVENLNEYVLNEKAREAIKNSVPKWIGSTNYYKIPHPEAVKYGQKKNFNYARGINLYPVTEVQKVITQYFKYFESRFDTEAFADDVAKGKVRGLSEEAANHNWRTGNKVANAIIKEELKPKATIKKQVPVKHPTVQSAPEEIMRPEAVPIDEVYALIDRMSELYQQSNNELKDKVNELMVRVETLTSELETKFENLNQIPETETEVETVPSVLILKEDATYQEWCKTVNYAVDLILKLKPEETKSSILSSAYNRLRAQYGIVWEQEAKEFKKENGRGPANTRELCYWLETNRTTYKNLLIGKLNTIYSEARRAAAKVG